MLLWASVALACRGSGELAPEGAPVAPLDSSGARAVPDEAPLRPDLEVAHDWRDEQVATQGAEPGPLGIVADLGREGRGPWSSSAPPWREDRSLVQGRRGSAQVSATPQAPPTTPVREELLWGGWHRVPLDPDAELVLRGAHALATEGLLEESIRALNLGIARAPGVPALLEARAALYAAMGYPRPAARDLEVATRLVPESGRTWFALGRVRGELDLPRASLEAFRAAERAGFCDPGMDLLAARALRKLGRRGEAAARYARALQGAPVVTPELYLEAGSLAFRPRGVSEEAWDLARDRLIGPVPVEEELLARRLLLRDEDAGEVVQMDDKSHLTSLQMRAWAQVALVAVRIEDPVVAKRHAPRIELALERSGTDPIER